MKIRHSARPCAARAGGEYASLQDSLETKLKKKSSPAQKIQNNNIITYFLDVHTSEDSNTKNRMSPERASNKSKKSTINKRRTRPREASKKSKQNNKQKRNER